MKSKTTRVKKNHIAVSEGNVPKHEINGLAIKHRLTIVSKKQCVYIMNEFLLFIQQQNQHLLFICVSTFDLEQGSPR